MTPSEFARRTRELLKLPDSRGRHRLFDELSNGVLEELGYREGVELFRRGVDGWHDEAGR